MMTITLPHELEHRLQAAVEGGRFASVDDAMAEAVRLLFRELDQEQTQTMRARENGGLGSIGMMREAADELDEIVADAYRQCHPDPLLGSMRDDAELMDEIVADAYQHRREESWRELDL